MTVQSASRIAILLATFSTFASCFILIDEIDTNDQPSSDYCNLDLDYDCYEKGKPRCCFDEERGCPDRRPICDDEILSLDLGLSILDDARTPVEQEIDYCTFHIDYHCYERGKPECCFDDSIDCPRTPPPCNYEYPENGYPGNPAYCIAELNYTCYDFGRPECCFKNEVQCNNAALPGCEYRTQIEAIVDYCSFENDFLCYQKGKPSCCLTEDNECPLQKPACEYEYPEYGVTDTPAYCSAEHDYDCYKQGRPRCCYDNELQCPEIKPKCNRPEFCLANLDFDCYEDGRPKCCSNDEVQCPVDGKPACDTNWYQVKTRAPQYCRNVDYNCYEKGRPQCCFQDSSLRCPDEEPKCNCKRTKRGRHRSYWTDSYLNRR